MSVYYVEKDTGIYTDTAATAADAIAAFVAKFGDVSMRDDGLSFRWFGGIYRVEAIDAPLGVNVKTWRADRQAAARGHRAAINGVVRDATWRENARQYGVDFANEESADIADAKRYR